MTPNREWEPVSIAVNCSGEIRAINANTRLGGEFANAVEEVSKEDAKVGVIHFDKHPITPEEPLLVRIFADKPVTVVVINNAVIPGLSRNDSKTGPKQP